MMLWLSLMMLLSWWKADGVNVSRFMAQPVVQQEINEKFNHDPDSDRCKYVGNPCKNEGVCDMREDGTVIDCVCQPNTFGSFCETKILLMGPYENESQFLPIIFERVFNLTLPGFRPVGVTQEHITTNFTHDERLIRLEDEFYDYLRVRYPEYYDPLPRDLKFNSTRDLVALVSCGRGETAFLTFMEKFINETYLTRPYNRRYKILYYLLEQFGTNCKFAEFVNMTIINNWDEIFLSGLLDASESLILDLAKKHERAIQWQGVKNKTDFRHPTVYCLSNSNETDARNKKPCGNPPSLKNTGYQLGNINYKDVKMMKVNHRDILLKARALQSAFADIKAIMFENKKFALLPYITTLDNVVDVLDYLYPAEQFEHFPGGGAQARDSFLDNLIVNPYDRMVMQDVYNTTRNAFLYQLMSFKRFLLTDGLRMIRAKPGVGSLPKGQDYYKACLQWYTTTVNPNPDDIHTVAMQKVDDTIEAIQRMMKEDKFTGSTQAYLYQLKTYDKTLRSAEGYSIAKEMLKIVERVRPLMSKIFEQPAPRENPQIVYRKFWWQSTEYRVSRINLTREADQDEVPHVVINANKMPAYRVLPLTLGLVLPGMHFFYHYVDQPKYLKVPLYQGTKVPLLHQTSFPAYYRGWEAYAQKLGFDLGMYNTQMDLLSYYCEELLRGALAVIDVGIHYKGWGRHDAINYLWTHMPFSDDMLAYYVDRAIAMPGDASAALMGSVKYESLRDRISFLGGEVDLRDFHSKILSLTPGPLAELEVLFGDIPVLSKLPIHAEKADLTESSGASTSRLRSTMPALVTVWLVAALSTSVLNPTVLF